MPKVTNTILRVLEKWLDGFDENLGFTKSTRFLKHKVRSKFLRERSSVLYSAGHPSLRYSFEESDFSTKPGHPHAMPIDKNPAFELELPRYGHRRPHRRSWICYRGSCWQFARPRWRSWTVSLTVVSMPENSSKLIFLSENEEEKYRCK